ncbi:MAG TPA: spore germination protein [Syntrophomonadaceae bacterium]|nr:spore germination protein [Syntrophomonadaceae bacterium]
MFIRRTNRENKQHNTRQLSNLEDANQSLTNDLESNIVMVNHIMGYASDIVVRKFTLSSAEIKAAIVTIKGLSERELINEQVLTALTQDVRFNNINSWQLFKQINQYGIPNIFVTEEANVENIINELMTGNTIFFMDGISSALIIGSQGWKERSVSEPMTENVVRGPRDGFTESIDTNTALIRRRIKSPDLRVDEFNIGVKTKTTVILMYLNGVASEAIVNEVKARLLKIHIDGILESGYIEELIEDNPRSPFPQIDHSERPDKVSAAILEGRVAIVVDNTPFVLIVPTVFLQYIQSPEDYYERFLVGSLTRFVRVVSYFISIILPALYIALTSFHQEMIPTPLALSIAASREGIPFPSIGEAFLMEATFEILREAGLRLPKQAGQAVSIVGGLVIGQAAVQAGIVSQAMVIVVALTGISSFAIPAYNAAAAGRLIRFPLMLMSSVLGLPGILAGLTIILIHLSSLRSFGVNFLDPFTSPNEYQFKDTLVRAPWWGMFRLPGNISEENAPRVGNGSSS